MQDLPCRADPSQETYATIGLADCSGLTLKQHERGPIDPAADAFYDGGGICPLSVFLNDGAT